MVLQSQVPLDVTPGNRLREYLAMVRDLSLARSPEELIDSYRARARFVVPSDQFLSLSRRAMPPGSVRITRSTQWETPLDPWRQFDQLPVVREGMLVRLAEAGQPVKIDDLEVDPADPFEPYARGMRSMIAVPTFHEGEPLYMVVLMREELPFTLDELNTVLLTSNLIGRATSQLVLAGELSQAYTALDREFRAVGDIQRQLLPRRTPRIPGATLATYYETSKRAGGDYFDYFKLPDGTWSVIIADVSGHGPAAAVVMAMIRSLLHAPLELCPPSAGEPAAALRFLNAELLKTLPPGQFVTAFIAVYDPKARRLKYANAGHHPPRWLRCGQAGVAALEMHEGIPLGISEPHDALEREVQLSAGDRLLLFTDGVTETFNRKREMFGLERLDAALRQCSRSPSSLIEAITAALNEFADGAPVEDDRTLVALAFDAT